MRNLPSAITRWSQSTARTVPPAGACPVNAATTGSDPSAIRCCRRQNAIISVRSDSAEAITSRTSSPAENIPGCPDSTTARTVPPSPAA